VALLLQLHFRYCPVLCLPAHCLPPWCSLKASKIIAVGLVIVVIAGVTATLLRDRIIQRLSGPFLLDYGLTLADVSLDALSTKDASIRYLELKHESGTVFQLSDLRVPLRMAPDSVKSFSVGRIRVIVPDGDARQKAPLADIARQIMTLPESLPNTELFVSTLDVASYPLIENLEWRSTAQDQTLSVNVESLDVHSNILRKDADTHKATLTVGDRFLSVNIVQQDSAVLLNGAATLELPATFELLRSILGLPPQLAVASGSADLRYDVTLPSDSTRSAGATLHITPVSPINVDYSAETAAETHIQMTSGSPLVLALQFPQVDWTIEQSQASFLVSSGKWQQLPVAFSNVVCRSNLTCASEVQVDGANVDLGLAVADALHVTASQRLSMRDADIVVSLAPQASVILTGLAGPDLSAKRVTARLVDGASFELTPGGWQAHTQAVEASIEAFSIDGMGTIDVPLVLGTLDAGKTDQELAAELHIQSAIPELQLEHLGLTLPELAGNVALRGNEITAQLSLTGRDEAAESLAFISHNLESEAGDLRVTNALVDFARHRLSERIVPWPYELDLTDGNISADMQVAWEKPRSAFQFTAQSWVELSGLAGVYGETAFAGLSAGVRTHFASASGVRIEPVKVAVALIEIGLPIEDLSADLTPDIDERSVQVDNLRMHAFGGVVRADSFSYDSAAESNTLILRAESIELTELLTLKEFEDIELSGSIAAVLPVTVAGEAVTISGGKLTGEGSGGVIRYLPGLDTDETGTSTIGLVTRALSNFEYQTLESDVDYDQDCDLQLQMKMSGRNPDLEGGRTVVLNLGVENNVPKMLRSLQAARAVEEILQRRIEK